MVTFLATPLTPALSPRQPGGEGVIRFPCLLMGALKEFHHYPLSPNGGEGQGEGELNRFSAPVNDIFEFNKWSTECG
jgi:hypothetical protein